MPRTKLGDMYSPPKRPKLKPNYWHEYIKTAYKAKGWTSKELAEAVGENACTTRARIVQKPEKWKIEDVYKYCDVLGIEHREALDIILMSS